MVTYGHCTEISLSVQGGASVTIKVTICFG